MQNFRKLRVYEEALEVGTRVLEATKDFDGPFKFSIGPQMVKSATSIPSNLAEGAGRHTGRSKIYFWNIALASAHELEAQIELCHRAHIHMPVKTKELIHLAYRIRRLISKVDPDSSQEP